MPEIAQRAMAPVFLMVVACVLAAGCASSSTKATTASPRAAQELAFSECMRANGVPNFPDPGARPNGSFNSIAGIAFPTTIDIQSPAFRAANDSCHRLLLAVLSPEGKPPITDGLKASLIGHAQCMRTHGVPAYPDPVFPPGGGIKIFDNPGVNPQSPAYQHAQSVCGNR